MYVYIYIYIYIERERESEGERGEGAEGEGEGGRWEIECVIMCGLSSTILFIIRNMARRQLITVNAAEYWSDIKLSCNYIKGSAQIRLLVAVLFIIIYYLDYFICYTKTHHHMDEGCIPPESHYTKCCHNSGPP